MNFDYKNWMKLKDDSSEYTLGSHRDVLNCLAEGLKNSYLVYFFVTFSQNLGLKIHKIVCLLDTSAVVASLLPNMADF